MDVALGEQGESGHVRVQAVGPDGENGKIWIALDKSRLTLRNRN